MLFDGLVDRRIGHGHPDQIFSDTTVRHPGTENSTAVLMRLETIGAYYDNMNVVNVDTRGCFHFYSNNIKYSLAGHARERPGSAPGVPPGLKNLFIYTM
jgi:hypothetical protein